MRSRRLAVRRSVLAAALLLSVEGGEVRADTELSLFHLNDLGTLTRYNDDLYTATLGAGMTHGRFGFVFSENMFTDHTHGTRFDETQLTVSTYLPPASGWAMSAMAGGVHVGRGIFGESFQNRFHDLISSDRESLAYIDEDSMHLALGFEASRPHRVAARVVAGPRFELYEAFGFKGHALAGLAIEWEASDKITLFGTAAARYSSTELEALVPWVGGLAPASEIGLSYRGWVSLAYSYNAFGTEDHHWRIGLQLGF